jgi:hypothetical protein
MMNILIKILFSLVLMYSIAIIIINVVELILIFGIVYFLVTIVNKSFEYFRKTE